MSRAGSSRTNTSRSAVKRLAGLSVGAGHFVLRHTAASLAVSAGANVKAVQRMLGHARASMTLDVYADLFDDDLDNVAEHLDAAIKSAAAVPLRSRPAK
jgi:integrase